MNSILRNCSCHFVRSVVCGLLIVLAELCSAVEPLGGSHAAWQAISNGAPVRVAVFVDNGARNLGCYYHLMMATYADGVKGFPIDSKMIRAGALDQADLLIMPGGRSPLIAKMLGAAGAQKIRDFLLRGGSYIGTCAGCVLLSESTKSHPNMLEILPYKSIFARGHAQLAIAFNEDAEKICGIKKGSERIRYAGGPVLVPAKPVPHANFTVIGRYNSNFDFYAKKERESMVGKAAVFAGTYGAGRVFVSAVHPESSPSTRHFLQSAFRYVTYGRSLNFTFPPHKVGQLNVGIQTDSSFGVNTARFVMDLLRKNEFDVRGINAEAIRNGQLHQIDVLLVPDALAIGKESGCLAPESRSQMKKFLARGGRLISWGAASEHCQKAFGASQKSVADSTAALAALRQFDADPLPVPKKITITKVSNPIRTIFYTDTAGSNYILAGTLLQSPDYEVTFATGKEIADGALKNADLLLQPGGGCHRQYLTLGDKGYAAISNFVYQGGKFYGVCAGAFMASQQLAPNRPRIGLVPWKNDADEPYRGTAELPLKITPEGREIFGPAKTRTVQYYCGPVLIPGTPIPDSDVKVLATYDAYTISTFNPSKPLPMRGKAAFVGGRVGKGKVFVSCPHPEFHEYSYDLALSGLGFLTGRKPSFFPNDRVRGALEIGVKFSVDSGADTKFYFTELMTDKRFHTNTGFETASGLRHLDAVVLLHPDKKKVSFLLKPFAQKGRPVFVLATTEEQRACVKQIPGVKIVATTEALIAALANYRETKLKARQAK